MLSLFSALLLYRHIQSAAIIRCLAILRRTSKKFMNL